MHAAPRCLIGADLIHQANPCLLFQHGAVLVITHMRFCHGWDDIQQGTPCAGANVGLLSQTQHFRMTWRNFQQFVDAVACGVIFITRQLQANAGDFDRDRIVSRQLGGALQMLIGAGFITALLAASAASR
jgi:hypothetical protein